MLAQQEVAFATADSRVNQSFEVLIDSPPVDGFQVARHAGQAPEVDSVTLLQDADLAPGTYTRVRCIGRRDYDLLAVPASVSLPTLAAV